MGLFISFEGPDGSGKSTQVELLCRHLESKGIHPTVTREPGGTKIGEKIRNLILDKDNNEMTAETEAFLYAASRAQHVSEVIEPTLENGGIVICDRYLDSSLAYQAYGRALGSMVSEINKYAVRGIMPDITFLIQVSPEVGRTRRSPGSDDRIESEALSFHESVLNGYKEIAEKDKARIVTIDGSGNAEDISKEIIAAVENLL